MNKQAGLFGWQPSGGQRIESSSNLRVMVKKDERGVIKQVEVAGVGAPSRPLDRLEEQLEPQSPGANARRAQAHVPQSQGSQLNRR